jgi:hypothetical protein
MTREIIVSVLEGEGVDGKGGSFKIGEEREATCFISTHGVLGTGKDERFTFAYGDVLGFKMAAPSQHKDRSAGFR